MVHEASELAAVAIADLDRVTKLTSLDPGMSPEEEGALIRTIVSWGIKVTAIDKSHQLTVQDLDRLYSAKCMSLRRR